MPFLLPLYTFDKVKCRVAALPRKENCAPETGAQPLFNYKSSA